MAATTAAVVGAGAAVAGAVNSRRASDRAADVQEQSSEAAIAEQRAAREEAREINAPFLEFGTNGIPALDAAINADGAWEVLQGDPTGYNFLQGNPMFQAALDESAQQMMQAGAAGGRFGSGSMVDALMQRYLATGDQYFGNYLNRLNTLQTGEVSRALLPVQIGQSAANLQAANLGNYANSTSNLITQGGNAQAAGIVGGANAINTGLNSLLGIGTLYGQSQGWFNQPQASPVTYNGTTYASSNQVPLIGPRSF